MCIFFFTLDEYVIIFIYIFGIYFYIWWVKTENFYQLEPPSFVLYSLTLCHHILSTPLSSHMGTSKVQHNSQSYILTLLLIFLCIIYYILCSITIKIWLKKKKKKKNCIAQCWTSTTRITSKIFLTYFNVCILFYCVLSDLLPRACSFAVYSPSPHVTV